MLKIYKASAGSGKTYTLAYEYIRGLLGVKVPGTDRHVLNSPRYNHGIAEANNRHRHILAITFTNKATEEMKRRIVDELEALTRMPRTSGGNTVDANYAKALCQTFGCTRAELAEVASRALRQLLNDYSQFNVATIDSFFQRVLRTFARELDHQGDFSVEINDKAVVDAGVNFMIDEFNIDPSRMPQMSEWIYDYMSKQLDKGEKSNFFHRASQLHRDMVELVSCICEETFKPYADEMKQRLADHQGIIDVKNQLLDYKDTLLAKIKHRTEEMQQRLEVMGGSISQMSDKSVVKRLILNNFAGGRAPSKKDLNDGVLKDNSSLMKMCNGGNPPFAKKYKSPAGANELVIDYLLGVRTLFAEYHVLDDVIDSVDNLILLSYAWEFIDRLVRDNNLVLLSDTNHLLHKIIGDDTDTPFIYERMGVQLQQYLIDEFQDTSAMQWSNLRPLVANGLSEDQDSLIIGDEKQSIYRFRNSDSSLLHTQVPDHDFAAPRYDTRVHGGAPGENTNYRSAADVVRFNNSLFTLMANSPGSTIEGYENVVQDISAGRQDLSGFVTFIPVASNSKSKPTAPVDDDDESADSTDEQAMEIMASHMLRQHNEGGYRWADMGVLTSQNIQAARVVNFLVTRHPEIPVLSDEALYLRHSQAVQLVTGALECLASESYRIDSDNDHKYLSGTEVAMTVSRFVCLHNAGVSTHQAICQAMPGGKRADALSVGIEAVKARKPSTLPALVEALIHELVPEPERVAQMAYLSAFQDYVLDYCNRFIPSVSAFVNKWKAQKDDLTVASAPDIDAVRVMTVHKSKGLEFDCVHIPFGSWPAEGGPRRKWLPMPSIPGVDPDKAPPALTIRLGIQHRIPGTLFYDQYLRDRYESRVDTMNLTYVAYTRAARELIVCYRPDKGIDTLVRDAMTRGASLDSTDPRLCDLSEGYDIDTGVYELGAPTVKDHQKDTGDTRHAVNLDCHNIYFHSQAALLMRVDDMLDLDPDINAEAPEEADAAPYDADPEAREQGIVLHDILSGMVEVSDLDRAVDRAAVTHGLDDDGRRYFRDFIAAMLEEAPSVTRRWWDGTATVLTEQTIYVPASDGVGAFRRPDRIMLNADGTVDIVDYKFTRRALRSHERQVQVYMALLASMGYERVRGHLWYPFMHKVVTVKA